MHRYKKDIKISWKSHTISLIAVIILFIISGKLSIDAINKYSLKQMKESAKQQSEIHQVGLSNIVTANKKMENLLDEKLLTTCKLVVSSQENLNNRALEIIASDLNVNVIYWYSPQGKVIYSSHNYIGWQAAEGNIIDRFIKSKEDFMLEPIQVEGDTGALFKYASLRAPNGEFVQVGVLADNIYALTNYFCPQEFVENIMRKNDVSYAYFEGNENSTLFCKNDTVAYDYEFTKPETQAIESGKPYYGETKFEGTDYYELFMPIFMEDEKIGTLIMLYSLDDTKALVNRLSFIAILLLVIVFLIFGLMTSNSIRKIRT